MVVVKQEMPRATRDALPLIDSMEPGIPEIWVQSTSNSGSA